MSTEDTEPEDAFPEVQTGPITALVVTALSAGAYAAIFIFLGIESRGVGLALYASLLLATVLLLLSYIDLRTGLLPDLLTLPLIGAGLVYAFSIEASALYAVIGAGMGYLLVAGLALFWRKYRGYEGIGLGDAKLLAAGGAWVGIGSIPLVLLIASGLGILATLTVSQKTRTNRLRFALPFGPCLCFGIWVAWCVGQTLISI